MPLTLVAIDLETTGLDPAQDEIIEVAAVTFQGSDVQDEFSSLVDPRREISGFITGLTGITNEMVAGKPTIGSLRSQLNTILGDHVLVGHNVGFDTGFLRAAGMAYGNQVLDTLTLASILMPEAGRLGLEALARYLQLPVDPATQHRALNDALQTAELYLALRERALELSLAQLEEIVGAGRNLGWPETLFFEDVLAERARHAFEESELRQRGRLLKLFKPPKIEGRVLVPAEHPELLDVEWMASMLEPEGQFSRVFEGFEYRPQQVEMLQAVGEAFNSGQHILIEAGTGTGKSLGYLLPAAFWATENDRRIVISTNTINLQDQLIEKDVPALRDALGLDLYAAVRKGRSNYLCTRLFQQMRRSGPNSDDEMALYARILLWLPHSQTGDRAELNLRTPGQRQAWSRLNGENVVCTPDVCAAENCPLHVARRQAELAHIVVVNHALLLADMATGNFVLPDFYDLIIDEAHHLEDAVTRGLSFRTDRRSIERTLQDATRPQTGLVGKAQQRLATVAPPDVQGQVNAHVDRIRSEAEQALDRLEDFFATMDFFLQGQREGQRRGQFADQIRLTSAIRAQPDFGLVEEAWENLSGLLRTLAKRFGQLAEVVDEAAASYGLEGEDEVKAALMGHNMLLDETLSNVDAMIFHPVEAMIYWVEQFRDNISLHAAPLHVGHLVYENIFEKKEAVIMTSATLRTAGFSGPDPSFEYVRERLGAGHVDELAVGSPFDYEATTLLYLVSDVPEPNQPGYQQAVERAIIDTATSLGGRTLVLFTANRHLAQTAEAIEARLSSQGIMTLAQRSGSSRQQLLEQFKQPDSHSVLLGSRSFWEGIDVPGPALEALMIVRLPFAVPSDPVVAARSETYENAFYEYTIPESVLRFRQGFGRLIRRTTDEGIVVSLDKRILTKRYGELFLQALPQTTVVRQPGDRLPEIIERWQNRAR